MEFISSSQTINFYNIWFLFSNILWK